MRVGHGYDAHRFAPLRPLIIGGVTIPHDQGMEAHSDGDVLLHALCDGLLGAAGLGDIGRHFPDGSAEFSGIDSRILLQRVVEQLHARGLTVANADLTIIAQKPRMASYIPQMCANIAADLKVAVDRVNVKATTTERMGFTGRAEGIAAHAVVLLNEP